MTTEEPWILRYTATQDVLAMVNDEPYHLTQHSTFQCSELDALHLLALLQRNGRHGAATIVYRPPQGRR
jgi:hypothetical protein